MASSTFADRLWWSRHRMHLGATKLARIVGCAQSLISSLERNNAEKSKLNDKFAKALKVDPVWLAFGGDNRAPEGFDEDAARRGRLAMGGGERTNVVTLATPPRWAESPGSAPLSRGDQLHTSLINMFMEYAREVGADRATKAIDVLKHAVELVAFEQTGRQDKVSAANERHDRPSD